MFVAESRKALGRQTTGNMVVEEVSGHTTSVICIIQLRLEYESIKSRVAYGGYVSHEDYIPFYDFLVEVCSVRYRSL